MIKQTSSEERVFEKLIDKMSALTALPGCPLLRPVKSDHDPNFVLTSQFDFVEPAAGGIVYCPTKETIGFHYRAQMPRVNGRTVARLNFLFEEFFRTRSINADLHFTRVEGSTPATVYLHGPASQVSELAQLYTGLVNVIQSYDPSRQPKR